LDAGFEFSVGPSKRSSAEASDFFDALFGRTRQREHASQGATEFHARGEDHHEKILIELREALKGATRAISLRVPEVDATGQVALWDRTPNVQIPNGLTEGQHIRLKGQAPFCREGSLSF
jgi:curved DNA-binding protein